MKYHQDQGISLRTSEQRSMAHCKRLNKETIMAFFDKYESILDVGQSTTEKM